MNASSEARLLRAGAVSVCLGGGDLRHICVGAAEAVERIYFAVRDTNWGTVPGQLSNVTISEDAGGFTVGFDCLHKQGEVDFHWRGEIHGDPQGTVRFQVRGEARAAFHSNRISLCVHHPLAACAGKPCRIEKVDGSVEESRWPELVSPHQPFFDIRSMGYEFSPGLTARIRFEGGVFETEDQRNWSDNNFKTYSPPLSLPFPVLWKPGDQIAQRIEISILGDTARAPAPEAGPVVIRLLPAAPVRMPRIGLCLPPDGPPLSRRIAERINRLNLSHLRAEFTSENAASAACQQAATVGLPLEAAVTLPGPVTELARFAPSVCRWLVQSPGKGVTTAESLQSARELLGPDALLGAGSNLYFTELNRERLAGLNPSAAYYPVHPQVHASDDESVLANVRAQRDVVRTARSFLGDLPLWISPVTLGPLEQADPRQRSPFCAAWTVGSLKYLAESGVASVTYFQTHGPHGVQEEAETYPVFRVFELLADFRDGEVLPVSAQGPVQVEALLLAKGARRRLLIANLSSAGADAVVEFRGGLELRLAPYAVESLDWEESA